jgi:hypothetical protein
MNGAEALTNLIALADDAIKEDGVLIIGGGVQQLEDVKTAAAVCTAMLNTMMPIARWRAFVQIDEVITNLKKGGTDLKVQREEYTICSVSIAGIKNGLLSLAFDDLPVHVSLWEQKATGADMVSAYQGKTKAQQYRVFLRSLDHFEKAEPDTMQ